jgi:2-polyprenyl-3-methyl-5-hydroxy-6-metoxy-1,4-benzoquinol methylase
MKSRLEYLLWALSRSVQSDKSCPACKTADTRLIRRKYLATALRECPQCGLRFRTPKDDKKSAEEFYREEVYKQGFTTDLPSDSELQAMLATRFAGTEKDFTTRIDALVAAGLPRGARILDFGSSWGYGSWQMREAGFEVFSYELGRNRDWYAKAKLGCKGVPDLRDLDGTIDCFFSAHVIEHLPDPYAMFEEAVRLLRPGGMFVCFCPNGAKQRELRDPKGYHANWNMVHPLLLTPEFMLKAAKTHGFTESSAFSTPVTAQEIRDMKGNSLDGDDLLLIAR